MWFRFKSLSLSLSVWFSQILLCIIIIRVYSFGMNFFVCPFFDQFIEKERTSIQNLITESSKYSKNLKNIQRMQHKHVKCFRSDWFFGHCEIFYTISEFYRFARQNVCHALFIAMPPNSIILAHTQSQTTKKKIVNQRNAGKPSPNLWTEIKSSKENSLFFLRINCVYKCAHNTFLDHFPLSLYCDSFWFCCFSFHPYRKIRPASSS